MSNKLKPCPFCGNAEPEVERYGTNRQSCVVACGMCGCRLESNEIGAGHNWNLREASPTTAKMVELMKIYFAPEDPGHWIEALVAKENARAFIAEWERA